METSAEMKRRHQEEYNEFAKDHVHYAFGNKQLAELLEKLGYENVEALAVDYRSLYGGGIIRRDEYKDLMALFERQDKERKELRKYPKELERMFYNAMADLEYIIADDDMEVISYCGLSKAEFNKDKRHGKAFLKARTEYMAQYETHEEDDEE